jgi:predicted flap endonuclease-1-like 5' DNA nuclease
MEGLSGMTSVAHDSAAVTRSEVEALRRRLLALRGDIDEILTRLAHSPAPGASMQPRDADESSEEPAVIVAPPAAEVRSVNSTRVVSDDLTLIAGVDPVLTEVLNSLGIVAFSQVAHWSARDVKQVSETLGFERRICKENWIEQAAMLASGRVTAFAGRRLNGHVPSAWDAGDNLERSRTGDNLGCETGPCAGDDPPVAEVASASVGRPPSGPVLKLDPYRGIPKLPRVLRKAPPKATGGGVALAVKLTACLIALVVAGLVMVDRDAWGSVPLRKKGPPALQAQVRASPADRAYVPSKSLLEMEGLTPEVR